MSPFSLQDFISSYQSQISFYGSKKRGVSSHPPGADAFPQTRDIPDDGDPIIPREIFFAEQKRLAKDKSGVQIQKI